MTKYSPEQVYSELRNQGMNSFQATTFLAIAWRESGGSFETTIHNGNVLTFDDSWGIYQINFFGGIHRDTTKECATDLKCSTTYAIGLYRNYGRQRNGPPMWGDWKVYKNADALSLAHWGDAKKVSQKIDASGAYPTQPSGGQGPDTPGAPYVVPLPGGGTIEIPFDVPNPVAGLLPGQKDITDMLKDILQVGIWLLIGMVCIIIGLWGVVNDTEAGRQVIDTAKTAVKTAAKVAVLA